MDSSNFSLSDIAAVLKDNDGFCEGGAWWIIILFIFLFGTGGWGNNAATNALTQNDLQRAIDLNSIQEGQAGINNNVQRVAYEVGGMVKDASYNNLSETRDVQMALSTDTAAINANVNNGFTNMQTGFCGTQRAIDGIKYEGAINTAAINANIDAKFAALEKGQLEQRIAAQDAQIQKLELGAALCGVPRVSPYGYGVTPNFAPYGPLYGPGGTAF